MNTKHINLHITKPKGVEVEVTIKVAVPNNTKTEPADGFERLAAAVAAT